MSAVSSIEKKLLDLKQEIKDWEHSFAAENNGTKPSLEDIKSNSEIQYKYKKYNKYKKAVKYQQEKENLTTPTKKQVKKESLATPREHASESPIPAPSPFQVKEIGPTPQLHGRVLSIFDIPVNSPKSRSEGKHDDIVFKTPSKKKKITFVTPHRETPTRVTTAKKVVETPVYLRQAVSHRSPMKTISSQEEILRLDTTNIATPPRSTKPQFNVEPSPMLSPVRRKVKRKSLFEMMNELTEIQNDVVKYEKDEEDLNRLIAEENRQALNDKQEDDEWNLMNDNESEVIQSQDPSDTIPAPEPAPAAAAEHGAEQEDKEEPDTGNSKRKWKQAKTQKRSTRRRKMKPLQLERQDEYSKMDIHEELKRMGSEPVAGPEFSSDEDGANHNEMILNHLEDEDDYTESSSSSSSSSEDAKPEATKEEKFKLLNTNFVRMKIHYKNRGKFRRR